MIKSILLKAIAFYLLWFLFPEVNAQIILPIEIIGKEGYTDSIVFNIDSPDQTNSLWIQANNLSYKDKGSVRFNQSPWIPFNNTTCKVRMPEAAFGGIGGGYSTVRFTFDIPANSLVNGQNKIYFRFNSSDGFSIGYRIINLNIKNSSGNDLIRSDQFTKVNPGNWTAPQGANAEEGKSLWFGSKPLKASYLEGAKEILASCSDCHAENGRDLKYFQYSNKSIIERAKFHGLSDMEGQHIAAYIRNLPTVAPSSARPWNPPYQPGPGLDGKPVSEWSAGAGLEWALDDDQQTLPYLFPEGIKKGMDVNKVVNVREIPIALQMPDWKHWLPKVHPKDIWGTSFNDHDPYKKYQEVRTKLSNNPSMPIMEKEKLITELKEQTEFFLGGDNMFGITGTYGMSRGPLPCSYIPGMGMSGGHTGIAFSLPHGDADCEDIMLSMNHWINLKHWEIMQEFELEDKSNQAYPNNGGIQRGWLGNKHRTVFELAPHRSASNSEFFKGSNAVVGHYFSTAWYQLQLIINGGNKLPDTFFPVDWNYHFIFQMHQANTSKVPQHLRFTLSLLYSFQMMNNGKLGGDGWWPHTTSPYYFMFSDEYFGNSWTKVNACQRKEITEGFMRIFVKTGQSFPDSEWDKHRRAESASGAIPLKDYIPSLDPNKDNYADHMLQSIATLKELGVQRSLIDSLADFGKRLWPQGEWQKELDKTLTYNPARGNGLFTAYYNGTEISGSPVKEMISENVNMDYGPDVSPINPTASDNPFSTEWTGYVTPYFTQNYIFNLIADDGVRLWINDILLINRWSDGVHDLNSPSVYLEKGVNYKIKIQHYDNTKNAALKLHWLTDPASCGGYLLNKEIVPQSQLFTNPCFDFELASYRTDPEIVRPDQPFKIDFTVKNVGNTASPKNGPQENSTSITYEVEGVAGTWYYSGFNNFLNPDEQATMSVSFKALPKGEYTIKGYVDDVDRHPNECNENNFYSFKLSVTDKILGEEGPIQLQRNTTISPNPFVVNTKLMSHGGIKTIEVYSSVGRLLESYKTSESELSLGNSWSPGLYLIKVEETVHRVIKY